MGVFEQAAKTHTKAMLETREGSDLLMQTVHRLNTGFYPEDWVDALFQNHIDSKTLEDAYCFLLLWSEIKKGDILACRFNIGSTPHMDAMVEWNNEILTGLQHPWYGEFWGGLGDCDGEFGYDGLLFMMNQATGRDEPIDVTKRTFALEVGTTHSWTTLIHLRAEGYLARWPYHSEDVWLFYHKNAGSYTRFPY